MKNIGKDIGWEMNKVLGDNLIYGILTTSILSSCIKFITKFKIHTSLDSGYPPKNQLRVIVVYDKYTNVSCVLPQLVTEKITARVRHLSTIVAINANSRSPYKNRYRDVNTGSIRSTCKDMRINGSVI